MRKFLFATVAWLCSAYALAQSAPSDTLSNRRHTIAEVEVNGSRRDADAASSAPRQTLTRAALLQMGATDVGEALRHMAGTGVRDYGGVGGLKTVSVRGMGSQHTAVSYDGVAIGDCQSGQVDLSRFRLANLSSVSLAIGCQDDIFLPARSFAAASTLSIQTLSHLHSSRPLQVLGSIGTGSYGLLNPALFLSTGWGQDDRNTTSLYIDWLRSDGAYGFHMMNGNKSIDEQRNNSDISALRLEAGHRWQPTRRQSLTAKAYYYTSERGLPGSVVYDNPVSTERLSDRNAFGQLSYLNTLSEKLRLRAAAKFNYAWQRDYKPQGAATTDDRFTQNETYLTATLLYQPLQQLSFSVAQDYAHNHLTTTLRNNQHPSRETLLSVVAANFAVSGFKATATLLSTNIFEHVQTGQSADNLHRLSPSVSLSWQPQWLRGAMIRASWRDIFRVPTFNDLYYLLIGNANLRPEKTSQWNLGLTFSRRLSATVERLTLTADTYHGSVSDKIVAVPTMFIWKMSNVGRVRMLGFDLTADAQLKFNKGWAMNVLATYGYLSATDRTDKSKVYYAGQIAYTPRHSASASLLLHTPVADLGYNLVMASERFTTTYNARENRIAPYADHSLSLSHRFRLGEGSLRLQAEVRNLSGKNYEVIRFYPMPGCNWRLTASWELF